MEPNNTQPPKPVTPEEQDAFWEGIKALAPALDVGRTRAYIHMAFTALLGFLAVYNTQAINTIEAPKVIVETPKVVKADPSVIPQPLMVQIYTPPEAVSINVTPLEVKPGGYVTVSWKGVPPPPAGTYIALVDPSDEKFPVAHANLLSQSGKLKIPARLTPGVYLAGLMYPDTTFKSLEIVVTDPSPTPTPTPTPSDPLVTSLNNAWILDGKSDKLKLLVDIYRSSSTAVQNADAKYPSDIFRIMHKAIGISLGEPNPDNLAVTILPTLRTAIGAELNKTLPLGPASTKALTPEVRQQIQTQFNRIQTALEALK